MTKENITAGERIAKLRRENNYTQEQLADVLEVSRQSVSKWEQDAAYPETDKLIRIADLFDVSVDYLLRGESSPRDEIREDVDKRENKQNFRLHYEYVSKTTLFGLPLVHVNVGTGMFRAKGVIAVGMAASGFLSLGIFSAGFVSLGVFSLGLLALGALGAGVVALGAIALGVIALGAVAVGVFSLGAISAGCFSVGALAVGQYVAVGDRAYAQIAVGKTIASGDLCFLYSQITEKTCAEIYDAIDALPPFWRVLGQSIKFFIHTGM